MTIRISGTTARDARHTVAPDGRARLHVEVSTGTGDVGVAAVAHAVLLVGQGAAAQIAARNAAHHLRAGRRVTVYGAGLSVEPKTHELIVVDCSAIHREVIGTETEPSAA